MGSVAPIPRAASQRVQSANARLAGVGTCGPTASCRMLRGCGGTGSGGEADCVPESVQRGGAVRAVQVLPLHGARGLQRVHPRPRQAPSPRHAPTPTPLANTPRQHPSPTPLAYTPRQHPSSKTLRVLGSLQLCSAGQPSCAHNHKGALGSPGRKP
eukprot:4940858-Pyramimonas_sp.AAC.1